MALKPITYIQFGAMTAEEWISFSVAKITTPVTRGNPNTRETPYDLRLGALENLVACETCSEKNNICPGHFGHIELDEPVYNPVYISLVLGIVKCICIECYSPRISKEVAEIYLTQHRKDRFKIYRKKAEVMKQCISCNAFLPCFFIDRAMIKMFYDDKKHALPISAREMTTILMNISSDTMELMGFNDNLPSAEIFEDENIFYPTEKNHVHEVRPEAFIFTVLPVLPTCARPWIIRDGERKDDDITEMYNTILKINTKLLIDSNSLYETAPAPRAKSRKKSGKLSEVDRKKLVEDLNSNIWALIDNSKDLKNKNNARQRKGISDRLKSKDGHLQNNVGGKRVDWSARTVIIPGGDILPMGWIGVPYDIAKILTTPEPILKWNIGYYQKMLEDGKINSVVRNGKTIPLSDVTGKGSEFTWNGQRGLQLYDIVHRQLKEGDWGIFNRQPTLRIESMQGVQCHILPPEEKAFRIPLCVTRAYNADCDGDKHLVPNRQLPFKLIGKLDWENSVILSCLKQI